MKQFKLERVDLPAETLLFNLPVGAAFTLVDAVAQEPGGALVTTFRVPEGAPYLRGEGQGPWIVPGTVMTEMAVQSGELLIAAHRGPTTQAEGVPVLTRVTRAAFRRVVVPGDVLTCRVELQAAAGPAFRVEVKLTCEGERVAEMGLAFAATQAVAALAV